MRTVSLCPEKAQKYREAIDDWLSVRTHTLEEAQKLHGKLLHASNVIHAGRTYVTALESFLSVFGDSLFKPRTPLRTTRKELLWWRDVLAGLPIRTPILGRVDAIMLEAYSDTSSNFGVGIVFQGRWDAWKYKPQTQKDVQRRIGWAEAVGLKLLVSLLDYINLLDDPLRQYIVFCDNQGVVEAWHNGRSRNPDTNKVIRRLHTRLSLNSCRLCVRYIASADNPTDCPSRGLSPPPPASLQLPPFPTPCALAGDFARVHDAGSSRNTYQPPYA